MVRYYTKHHFISTRVASGSSRRASSTSAPEERTEDRELAPNSTVHFAG